MSWAIRKAGEPGASDINASEGIQFDTYACVLNLVESGFGVALGRLSLVEEQLRTGKLIAPFSARLQSSEDFYPIYPQTGFVNPYARHFVKHTVVGKLTE